MGFRSLGCYFSWSASWAFARAAYFMTTSVFLGPAFRRIDHGESAEGSSRCFAMGPLPFLPHQRPRAAAG